MLLTEFGDVTPARGNSAQDPHVAQPNKNNERISGPAVSFALGKEPIEGKS
jgi:hypothetical protein